MMVPGMEGKEEVCREGEQQVWKSQEADGIP